MSEPFIPKEFIRITSGGGNIGHFHWCNQMIFQVQAWSLPSRMGVDPPTEVDTTEVPGSSAWIFTMADWFAWIFS